MKYAPCLALMALMLCGCEKNNTPSKKYTCSHPVSSAAPGLGFTGFSSMQMSGVIVSRYTANTSWATLIGRDTLDIAAFHFEHDTAYALEPGLPGDSFLLLQPGIDYKIQIPATAQEYTITGVTKPPDTQTWEQDDHCSPGSSQTVHTTYSLEINGRRAGIGKPMFFAHGLFMYYLQH